MAYYTVKKQPNAGDSNGMTGTILKGNVAKPLPAPANSGQTVHSPKTMVTPKGGNRGNKTYK